MGTSFGVLSPGTLLDGRYRLDEFVASGGMGGVWRATDTVLGRVVAVKVVLPALLTEPGFAARFRAEARILAALRHPNVVDVYDYGETTTPTGDALYLVMAYVDGESLYQRIAAGPLPVATTLAIVAQAADALEAAHVV
jgi:eukaryotic-like serine/threonine-protein kinase